MAKNPAVPESETPVNSKNSPSTNELVVPTAQMLTLTGKMRVTAAAQARCEEHAANKTAVTNEELSKPRTRSKVFQPRVQNIESSKPESKANITKNIASEAETEDEKSEQTAGVVNGLRGGTQSSCLRKG